MATTLKLEIVTAEGPVFSEDVELVTLPGVAGQFGVYPQHVPLMAQMEPGEIIVRKDGRDTFFACGGGLIEVTANRISILTDLRSQNRRSPPARRGSAEREALRRRSRHHQRLARSFPGAIARQAPPPRLIRDVKPARLARTCA
jgi:F-type H+-transporting ATPase subunit epsilon